MSLRDETLLITVRLPVEKARQLVELAKQELRNPREQAAYIIIRHLENHQANQQTSTPNTAPAANSVENP